MANPGDLSAEARSVFDLAACGLARTDGNGLFLHANQTFCNWVGYAEDELKGRRKLQDLLTMGGRIFHQTHWAPLLQMQGSVSELKLEIVHRDGQSIPMVINAIRRDTGGVIVHDIALYVARDRDKYERELLQARKRLEATLAEATRLKEEAKDRALFAEQMVGIVSHDLRNPLSTIQMGVTLLSHTGPTPDQLEIIGRISRAAGRSHRMIADLLDFTQARLGGGLSVETRMIDLHTTIHENLEELAQAFAGRKLAHEQSGDSGQCWVDPDRLAQLLGNLVGNAVAYGTPNTPVVVTSSVGKDVATVQVHNEGPAIPEDQRADLFKPMARGTAVTDSSRSIGLGLFIVAEIAKAHRGRIFVESTPAAGTTFTVEFPNRPPK